MAANPPPALAGLGLTGEASRTLMKRAVVRVFPKDARVLPDGDHHDALYIVLEGRVEVLAADSSGHHTVIAHHGPGEFFLGTGFDHAPHATAIRTVEPSRFLELPPQDFKACLPENRLFAARVFDNLVHAVEEEARELSEALQQKTAISAILRALSTAPTDTRSLLEAIAENAARLCDVTDAEILQVDGNELRLVAKHGPSRLWPIGATRRLTRQWVTGRAVLDRTPIHVPDLQAAGAEYPQGAAYAREYGHHTTFATPLMREGAAIGAILIRRLAIRPLTDRQIELLMTFADQAAIAIENVKLFNEIREKSHKLEAQARELAEWNATLETRVAHQVAQLAQLSKLEHELVLASEIQQSMLPRSIPRLDGYEFCARMIPAKSVGGDFFDFVPLGSDALAIAVGDVSDKGVPAALFMAMVRSLLRAEAHPGHSPAEVLRRVNRHLMDMNDKEMFVTVIFGILNRTTREFVYARAGHEPPLVSDGQGSIQRLPRSNGQPLGIFADIALDEQTLQLPPHRMMLLYSDGIPDATNRQDERFGLQRMLRAIGHPLPSSAPMVCQGLIQAVTAYQGDSPQQDDMTVIVVRSL
jgi:serine phosphatase RsbU (regulator of sigma subunit)/CRP-like cAMP-binding protein